MGETAAHALMGHQFYLKTYFKRSLGEIRSDYLKAVPNLLVMRSADEQETRKKHTFDILRGLGLNDEGIRAHSYASHLCCPAFGHSANEPVQNDLSSGKTLSLASECL
jgi:hypothetical protein